MSTYEFKLTVTVDVAELREHNERAQTGLGPVPIPADPTEWDSRDFAIAMDNELIDIDEIDRVLPIEDRWVK